MKIYRTEVIFETHRNGQTSRRSTTLNLRGGTESEALSLLKRDYRDCEIVILQMKVEKVF